MFLIFFVYAVNANGVICMNNVEKYPPMQQNKYYAACMRVGQKHRMVSNDEN